jgi:hypothetical protein
MRDDFESAQLTISVTETLCISCGTWSDRTVAADSLIGSRKNDQRPRSQYALTGMGGVGVDRGTTLVTKSHTPCGCSDARRLGASGGCGTLANQLILQRRHTLTLRVHPMIRSLLLRRDANCWFFAMFFALNRTRLTQYKLNTLTNPPDAKV